MGETVTNVLKCISKQLDLGFLISFYLEEKNVLANEFFKVN